MLSLRALLIEDSAFRKFGRWRTSAARALRVIENFGYRQLMTYYREADFDLLVTVPLHGGAAYIERSLGLGDALGFVPTDKRTLQFP